MGETIILQSTPKDWVDIMQALLTPAVAVAAVWIAFWQFRINSLRLKHELFDRRVQLYQKVQDAFGLIMRDGAASLEVVIVFGRASLDSKFLFGDNVAEYLDDAKRDALDAHHQARVRNHPRDEDARLRAIDAEYEAVGRLLNRQAEFQELVLPYMALNERLGICGKLRSMFWK